MEARTTRDRVRVLNEAHEQTLATWARRRQFRTGAAPDRSAPEDLATRKRPRISADYELD
jgi:hypothetical protein